jgi:uncharacterized protein
VIVVLDTNILARGSISEGTAVAAIIQSWRANRFTVAVSRHILDELAHALRKPYFVRHLSTSDRAGYEFLVANFATLVPITVTVEGVATQPADDLVLATAASAQADYLVTRDRQLLRLGSYMTVRIVSPTEFLTALSSRWTGPLNDPLPGP